MSANNSFKPKPLRGLIQALGVTAFLVQLSNAPAMSITKKRVFMQVVLIDTFVVPEVSREALVDKARESARFLRTLPGFVEGHIYEKTGGDGTNNVVTTAVWQDQAAFENAKKLAAEEFRKVGFNPQEIMNKLYVTVQRAVYQRSPY